MCMRTGGVASSNFLQAHLFCRALPFLLRCHLYGELCLNGRLWCCYGGPYLTARDLCGRARNVKIRRGVCPSEARGQKSLSSEIDVRPLQQALYLFMIFMMPMHEIENTNH